MLGTKILGQVSLAPQINIPSITLTQSSPIPEYSPGKAMTMDCHPFLRSSSSTWPHSPQPVPRVKTLSECHRCVCTHKHTHTYAHNVKYIHPGLSRSLFACHTGVLTPASSPNSHPALSKYILTTSPCRCWCLCWEHAGPHTLMLKLLRYHLLL